MGDFAYWMGENPIARARIQPHVHAIDQLFLSVNSDDRLGQRNKEQLLDFRIGEALIRNGGWGWNRSFSTAFAEPEFFFHGHIFTVQVT
jgi:hypothetical protein